MSNNSKQVETLENEPIDIAEQSGITEMNSKEENNSSIIVHDSSDYSIRFLSQIEESGMTNVILKGGLLILGSSDTVSFPETPEIGNRTVLTAMNDKLAIALTIERINYTSLEYKIEMVEFGQTTYIYKGYADLYPRFYLGSETDESTLSGISYLSTEYNDNRDSCYTYIRLGKEQDSGPHLLAKIIKNCNGKIQDIELDNFPTLVEK